MARCAFLLFVSFLPLAAQNASITGTVSDPQHAPIPNVSVTLTNVDMGIAVRANTDVEGNYEFGFVRPGNYIIKVEHPGFRAFQQGPIKLDIDQRARVNVGLELGEATSTVDVVADAARVQTESSTLGTVEDTRKILEIPLNGRFILGHRTAHPLQKCLAARMVAQLREPPRPPLMPALHCHGRSQVVA